MNLISSINIVYNRIIKITKEEPLPNPSPCQGEGRRGEVNL